MDRCASFDAYRMSDALWNQFKKLLPKYKVSPLGGRPRRDLRSIADAIFYRLKTGCQWKAIPPSLAPGSTAHEYFQEWVRPRSVRCVLAVGFARVPRPGWF